MKAAPTSLPKSPIKDNPGFAQIRHKRRESNLWQRRFWEHWILDDADFMWHCDYIHYNPVRHGLCQQAADWKYSSFHRYVAQGVYPVDWGIQEELKPSLEIWDQGGEGLGDA